MFCAFAHLFRQVTVKFDNFIVLESSKVLLNINKDVLFIFISIAPHGSPAYAQTADSVGVELIEQCLSDLYNTRQILSLFTCGDFNARTSHGNGRGPLDSV